jgi:Mn-dependent DtxR family transcriptional regulator
LKEKRKEVAALDKTIEDYLEAILMIKEERGNVRSIDIAEKLNVKKPSVTYATRMLKGKGYITMDESSLIILTDSGMKIATETLERHRVLTRIFTMLGVDEAIAEKDACRVEHNLSPETYEAIAEHIKKYG